MQPQCNYDGQRLSYFCCSLLLICNATTIIRQNTAWDIILISCQSCSGKPIVLNMSDNDDTLYVADTGGLLSLPLSQMLEGTEMETDIVILFAAAAAMQQRTPGEMQVSVTQLLTMQHHSGAAWTVEEDRLITAIILSTPEDIREHFYASSDHSGRAKHTLCDSECFGFLRYILGSN